MPEQFVPVSTLQLEEHKIPKSLRVKVCIIAGLAVFLSTLFLALTSGLFSIDPAKVFLQAALIPLLFGAGGTFLIWKFLKPIEKISRSAQSLFEGGTYQIAPHTGDELEVISNTLNYLSQKVHKTGEEPLGNQEAVSAENSKLEAVISSIVDGIIVLDLHGQIKMLNTSAEKLTGYSSAEALGKPIDQLLSLKDTNGKPLDIKIVCQNANSGGPNPSTIIISLVGKDQKTIQVKLTTTTVSGPVKADLGCILILHDMASEKAFEQMQIDFVSMASHEFRTPLTSVINYLSVLSEESRDKLDSEHQGFLDNAFSSAKELGALVDNILNVSKIERGSFAVALQSADWQETLKQVVAENNPQAAHKNISLNLKLPAENLPKVMVDNMRIREVLNNLISNAINYTPQGGKVEVGAKLGGGEITTYIADTGIGIPAEAIPHLFTKFYRVSGALERGSKGSGLGLYISKSIIDMHHGKIWVESSPGKGSVFSFTLPLSGNDAHPTIVELQPTSSPKAPVA